MVSINLLCAFFSMSVIARCLAAMRRFSGDHITWEQTGGNSSAVLGSLVSVEQNGSGNLAQRGIHTIAGIGFTLLNAMRTIPRKLSWTA